MLVVGVRVPGVPVVKTDTSGGGIGGGGSSTFCTRRPAAMLLSISSDAIASRCPYDGELQGLVGCRWPVLSCWRRV